MNKYWFSFPHRNLLLSFEEVKRKKKKMEKEERDNSPKRKQSPRHWIVWGSQHNPNKYRLLKSKVQTHQDVYTAQELSWLTIHLSTLASTWMISFSLPNCQLWNRKILQRIICNTHHKSQLLQWCGIFHRTCLWNTYYINMTWMEMKSLLSKVHTTQARLSCSRFHSQRILHQWHPTSPIY